MQRPHVRVVLGTLTDAHTDVVVRPGRRARADGRTITVVAPRWHPPTGPDRALAQAYRDAVAAADACRARSMALPAILARGAWPLDQVTRIALTVLLSTPSTVREVQIIASTPAMVERWAEALVREPSR
ncbi:MAG: macro domain-containing protein [Candidatus Nanopelagicales bacterium]